jgi:hypothetical protein
MSTSNTTANSNLVEWWCRNQPIQPISYPRSRASVPLEPADPAPLYRSIGWYTCRNQPIPPISYPRSRASVALEPADPAPLYRSIGWYTCHVSFASTTTNELLQCLMSNDDPAVNFSTRCVQFVSASQTTSPRTPMYRQPLFSTRNPTGTVSSLVVI